MAEKTVTLAVAHTHGGLKYEAGETLTVSAATAAWLEAQGIAQTGNKNTTPAAPADNEDKA